MRSASLKASRSRLAGFPAGEAPHANPIRKQARLQMTARNAGAESSASQRSVLRSIPSLSVNSMELA